MEKLIFLLLRLPNAVFSRAAGWTSRPVAYPEISAISPELARLEQFFPAIKSEYLSVRNRLEQVPRYHEVDGLQRYLSHSRSTAQNWRVFFLEAMGRKSQVNRQLCPKTAALIDSIPNVFQAFFSILEGGKSLDAHCSPYWGYLRYHLAIEVPKSDPAPRMRVKDRWFSWEEGKSFLFDDSWEHQLFNHNIELRSVLIVDVARPMTAGRRLVNRVCMFIMRYTYAHWVLRPGVASIWRRPAVW